MRYPQASRLWFAQVSSDILARLKVAQAAPGVPVPETNSLRRSRHGIWGLLLGMGADGIFPDLERGTPFVVIPVRPQGWRRAAR